MTATLTFNWDRLADPTDEDLLSLFGLEAETAGDNLPTLLWTSADLAWEWLSRWGFKPTGEVIQGRRLRRTGYVRPITIRFAKA